MTVRVSERPRRRHAGQHRHRATDRDEYPGRANLENGARVHTHAVHELGAVEQLARQLVRVHSQGAPVQHHHYGDEPGEDGLSGVDVNDIIHDVPRVGDGKRSSKDQC